MLRILWIGLVTALVLSGPLFAREVDPSGPVVSIALDGGSTLVGRIVAEDETGLTVRTVGGLELPVLRSSIVSIRSVAVMGGRTRRLDPHYSRLMFAPTGRPLRQGDGYFSNYELFFPGVACGITDHFSLAGGVTVIPGVRLSEQLFFVSPQVGFEISEKAAVGGGVLYASSGEDSGSLSIVFAVGTFGPRDRSLSVGLGIVNDRLWGDSSSVPVLMWGATFGVSDHVALVTESWLVLRERAERPLGMAVRFFGDRLSADVGVVLTQEILQEGLPFPWLSFSYHFGKSRGAGGSLPRWRQ